MLSSVISPVSMFCCGCSVRFGAGCIVLCHLLVCCFYVASACSNLIFKNAFFSSSWNPLAQLCYTAFSLVGIPIALMAFWGVAMRREINLRIYLFYLACSFVIDLGGLVYICLIEDPCNTVNYVMGSLSEQRGSKGPSFSGEAFMCGAFRIASYFLVTLAIAVQVYCLYVVWSMCEDIHGGKNGPELAELIPGKDDIIKKRRRPADGPYASIVGFAHTKVPGPYPSPYGTIRTSGMPGQSTIFGGASHETDYPPRQEDSF
eukprot:CAMPEP_0204532198 /NCGR_PEP_ID=MMETSP0661-20131031/11596_1 /ASSEMBLY_ACC=CAM_ASM_000606 /TAXON_ID=109239 /ORGANISM="Alexandrium margalefi, Strain AMGDE01CS-322" /LENGTH=259 /DNA_ID=CAMNT_0051538421 /DNA_START=77 /DNA_END=856 /DNA_ORIENTATION=+